MATVQVAVDEVAYDLDGAGDAESLLGALAEVSGDAGNAVRLLNAEAGDGEVGRVETDKGDVGAVEGSDEGKMDAAGGKHLAGEKGRDGVRDGVVDVEEVE